MGTLHSTTAELTEASRPRAPVGDDHARLRNEFLALASHELMTPVTSLLLGAELMRRELARQPGVPERVAAVLEVFDRQLGRLTLLFDELLQVTNLEDGPPELTLDDVDLPQLVHRVVRRLSAQLPEAARALTVEAEPGLAGRWDRAQIERVVLHLVKNALTFGEGKPITILVHPTPQGARIVVRDRGRGIAGEDQERIFRRFQRAVPVEHFGGLGLGLYLAHTIVRAHGGSIGVESEPGQGAVFTVDLPLAPGPGDRRSGD